MKFSASDILRIGGAILILIGVSSVATLATQSDFSKIMAFSVIAYFGYFLVIRKPDKINTFSTILGLAIVTRILLLFVFPGLSDDIYRFVWDGHLIHEGMNPYHHLPAALAAEGFRPSLFELLNSPDYFTIYPPLSQLVFYLSTFTDSISSSCFIMKLVFMVCELGGFYFLVKLLDVLQKPKSWSLIYFLNPLIIIEGVGNLHFEVVMLSCFIAALYYLQIGKMTKAGLFYAASIAFKLIPLMFLPYLFFALSGKSKRNFFMTVVVTSLILFSPILIGLDLANFGASLNLYFQKFEFNASIYYVLRYIGKLISGYNLIQYIGPILALTVVFYVIRKSFQQTSFRMDAFLNFCIISFSLYLFLATTVHPWYLCMLILLASLTSFKYPLIWSGLILLSYINYSYDPYWENLYIIAFEYLLLLVWMVYEFKLTERIHLFRFKKRVG